MNDRAAVDLQRRQFIGGSDVAGILGVSPWETPLDVYLAKTGQKERSGAPDLARERLFRRGKLLEPVALQMLIEDYGIDVTKRSTPENPNRYIDPEFDFLAAEVDYEWRVKAENIERWRLPPELLGTIQNGEIKTVHHFAAAKFGDAETEDVPIEYAAQAMHGLGVTDRQLTLFGTLFGADDLSPYFVHRDAETVATMRNRVVAFWRDHVLTGVPPDPVHLPDVIKLLRKAPSSSAEATEEILALCEDLTLAKERKAAAEDREVEIKYQLGKFVLGESGILLGKGGKLLAGPEVKPGRHEITSGGLPILNVTLQEQTRLDGDRIKRDHPEVAVECSKQISFFRFDPPRKKR